MGITIRDVAQAAGVSTATVSRALRGLPNVDDATRDRVQQVARDLDYVVSPSASRLASGRTGSVAVVTPYVSRWFFSRVLGGIENVLQERGTDLLLLRAGTDDAPPIDAGRLRRRVDGVLVIALPAQDPQLDAILSLGVPTCIIGGDRAGVPSVAIDDVEAARTATQHLINLGHERIGLISGSPGRVANTADETRFRGFAEVMAESGREFTPALEANGFFTIGGGEQAMTDLLARRNPPTAVFCMSDETAFGAMKSLRAHGLRPGADISLVGVDGHDMSDYLDLTTVAQPVRQLGRLAASALLGQIGGDEREPVHVTVPTHLIVRGSTAPRA